MKRSFLVLALLLSPSLPAQAPVAVPIAKEPHHHLVLENDYVRVFRVNVPAHDATLLHQHVVPYLYVSLGPADVINAVQGRPEARIVMADGQLGYSPGHFAHIARNLADTPFRNVTIEFLKPQGESHNLCSQFVLSDPIGPCNKPGVEDHTLEPQFDTSGISVDLLRFSSKTTIAETTMKAPFLIVSLRNSGVKIAAKGTPTRTLRAGEMEWFDAASSVQF
jgi:hypothetical protein